MLTSKLIFKYISATEEFKSDTQTTIQTIKCKTTLVQNILRLEIGVILFSMCTLFE